MSMPRMRFLIALVCSLIALTPLCAQRDAYREYIARYSDKAVEQMRTHGIPASITLAQGLLESGAGQSYLARAANNHFGIKVGSAWTGPYVLRDDDARGERFRKYRTVEQSYDDHAEFLTTRSRYASLFALRPDDYVGWAHGLKAAGYATNPRYAYSLIELIERYDLHRFDSKRRHHRSEKSDKATDFATTTQSAAAPSAQRAVLRCNRNYYVVASAADTYAAIARWAGMSERRLRRYNEVPRKAALQQGDIVFLEKKQKRADRTLRGTTHCVAAGESLHTIAQTYGVRLKTLTKANREALTVPLHEGMLLRLP